MATLHKHDFIDAIPADFSSLGHNEMLWNYFSCSGYQDDWQLVFDEYTAREALQTMLRNFCERQVSRRLDDAISLEYWDGRFADRNKRPAGILNSSERRSESRYTAYKEERIASFTYEEYLRLLKFADHSSEVCSVPAIHPVRDAFRFATAESLSRQVPFNDWVKDDPNGGGPSRSKIVTGNLVPIPFDAAASVDTNIPWRRSLQLTHYDEVD